MKQLYKLTRSNFELPYSINAKAKADYIPVLFWPDGTICWEANSFIIHLYQYKNYSRLNKGGTLVIFAKHLSLLIRFCYYNRTDFVYLTYEKFVFFINGLIAEKDLNDPTLKRRSNLQVVKIGRSCLRFLKYLEYVYNIDFVEKNIKAIKKTYNYKTNTGFIRSTIYWHHPSFPTTENPASRLPITDDDIKKLKETIVNISPSSFIRERRTILIHLLEMTGARRTEIANIKIDDIKKAYEHKNNMILLFTAKQKNPNAKRLVPIFNKSKLKGILDYIDIFRKSVIKKTIGIENDHGFLFISGITGKPLNVNTFSNEISKLRNASDIKDKVHMHCFRHKYITDMFVKLIKIHHCESKDDIQKLILDTETLKTKVMQWSGHRNIKSLDRYIHLAFYELTNFKETEKQFEDNLKIDAMKSNAYELLIEMERDEDGFIDNMTNKKIRNLLKEMIDNL